MPTAEAVARYFLHLAAKPQEASPITHLQLQKLMYYGQGWSLASRDRRLFEGRIEAWAHGPVVVGLFPVFADHGDQPIPWEMAAEDPSLSDDDRALIESVWEGYGRFSAWRLRQMSHAEPPWKDARAGIPAGAPSKAAIPEESLQRYFKGLQESRLRRMGIDPESLEVSLQQSREGKTVPFEELRAETFAALEKTSPVVARQGTGARTSSTPRPEAP